MKLTKKYLECLKEWQGLSEEEFATKSAKRKSELFMANRHYHRLRSFLISILFELKKRDTVIGYSNKKGAKEFLSFAKHFSKNGNLIKVDKRKRTITNLQSKKVATIKILKYKEPKYYGSEITWIEEARSIDPTILDKLKSQNDTLSPDPKSSVTK